LFSGFLGCNSLFLLPLLPQCDPRRPYGRFLVLSFHACFLHLSFSPLTPGPFSPPLNVPGYFVSLFFSRLFSNPPGHLGLPDKISSLFSCIDAFFYAPILTLTHLPLNLPPPLFSPFSSVVLREIFLLIFSCQLPLSPKAYFELFLYGPVHPHFF